MIKENLNEKVKEILNYISLNKFKQAEDLKLKMQSFINKETDLFLEGMIYFSKKDYKKSISFFEESHTYDPKNLLVNIKLAESFDRINDLTNAEKYLNQAININSNSDIINNSLGYNLYKQNKIQSSIKYFIRSINLNKNNFKAYFNLANSYLKNEDYSSAIKNFKAAINIKKNIPDATFFIAESYKNLKDFENALKFYQIARKENNTLLRNEKIIAKILELYLIQNNKKQYLSDILVLSKKSPNNRRIAATSAFIAHQFKVEDHYPFCPNPLDFIYENSLKKHVSNYEEFLNSIYNEIMSLNFTWNPIGNTTRNGFRTTENLSKKNLPYLSKLEKIVLKELNKYFDIYKNNEITYIQNWPTKFEFEIWSNRLKRQGHNITHIHPGGWVSAVFYLKIPKNIKGDQAGIEFSLHGDDYFIIDKKIPTKLINPTEGNIVLFPSSLFHRTIPFESDEERVGIAMDLCPSF